jgi:hypothetical protein
VFEPIAIVVPSLNGALHGLLYPADETDYGLALLEGVGATSPTVGRIYDELAAYVRAAGVTVLRLEGQPALQVGEQVPDILAAVSALHSLDVEHVVLVAPALQEEPTSTDVAGNVFMGFVEAIAAQSRTSSGAGMRLEELAQTIALASERLAGVAVLLLDSMPAAHTQRRRALRAGSLAIDKANATGANAAGALPRLLVPVLTADADGAAITGAISKLYTWTTRTLEPSAPARAASGMRLYPAARVSAPGVERTRQLNRQWAALLARLETRAPARAARVRALLAGGNERSEPSVVRSAGHAWRALDREARTEWLRVCTRLFSPAGPAMS